MPFTSDWIPIYPQGIKCPDCESEELSYRSFQDEPDDLDPDQTPSTSYKVQCSNCDATWWTDETGVKL